jgi:hypothetical protein
MGVFLVGTLSGVVASLLLIILLRLVFSPRIKISPEIWRGSDAHGNVMFRFRISNISPRQAINVRCFAHRLRSENGKILSKRIPIVTNEIICLEPYDHRVKRDDYYSVIRTRIDRGYNKIEKIFEESPDVSIRLRAIATDPYSQVTKVFTHHFAANDVRDKELAHAVGLRAER